MSDKSFDLDTVKKLAELVKKNDLGEITVADGDKRITIKGKVCTAAQAAPAFLFPDRLPVISVPLPSAQNEPSPDLPHPPEFSACTAPALPVKPEYGSAFTM